MIGNRFGRLRVVEHVGTSANKRNLWRCICECGGTKTVCTTELRRGMTQSCGCLQKQRSREHHHARRANLSSVPLGKTSGHVISPTNQFVLRKNGNRAYLWLCQCECGAEFLTTGQKIIHGKRIHCDKHSAVREAKINYTSIRAVLKSSNGYKSLTPGEKKRIIVAAGKGDRRAREALILLYNGFVHQQARQFAARRRVVGVFDMEELVQECRIGLLSAAERWKPGRGAFTTYAVWWILHAMDRGANSGLSIIDVPALAHKHESTRDAAKNARGNEWLDAPLGHDDDRTMMDVLAEDGAGDDEALDKARMTYAVNCLPAKYQTAVRGHYLEEKTLEEVANEQGVTKECIRQRVERGLTLLRKRFIKTIQ